MLSHRRAFLLNFQSTSLSEEILDRLEAIHLARVKRDPYARSSASATMKMVVELGLSPAEKELGLKKG